AGHPTDEVYRLIIRRRTFSSRDLCKIARSRSALFRTVRGLFRAGYNFGGSISSSCLPGTRLRWRHDSAAIVSLPRERSNPPCPFYGRASETRRADPPEMAALRTGNTLRASARLAIS